MKLDVTIGEVKLSAEGITMREMKNVVRAWAMELADKMKTDAGDDLVSAMEAEQTSEPPTVSN